MGLRNHQKYSLTDHAFERYKERFNPTDSHASIERTVKNWLSQSAFLAKETKERQSWFYQEKKTVIVVDPTSFLVITLYSTLDEYKNNNLSHLHPRAEEIVSELVEGKMHNVKTGYLNQLGILYTEYADRLVKLAKTTKKGVFADKEAEAINLKNLIEELEEEYDSVIESLEDYIQK